MSNVWICHFFRRRTRPDFQIQRRFAGLVDEVVAVGFSGRESGRHSRRQLRLTGIRTERDRAFEHIHKLILTHVPVTLR